MAFEYPTCDRGTSVNTSPSALTHRSVATGLAGILAMALSLLAVLTPGAGAAHAATLGTAPTEVAPMAAIGGSTAARPYIVVLRPGTLGGKRGLTAKRERGRLVTSIVRSVPGIDVRFRYTASMAGFAADLTPAQVRRLDADPAVARIVPDATVSVSAVTPAVTAASARASVTDAQSTPVGIARVGGASWSGSSNVDVAVVDTGIGMSGDLTMGGELNVVGGKNCSGDGSAVDDIADVHGHGSHVAGTIGARDNDIGVVGIAPGIRLWSLRVFNSSGSGTTSAVICAIDWTAAWTDTHSDRRLAVNMSLGGSDFYRASATCGPTGTSADPEHQSICSAVSRGVVFVVAAGNASADADLTVPARYGEVITVSAIADYDGLPGGNGSRGSCAWTTADDAFASFSNYGAVVDITAPGVCVKSTSRSAVGATVTMSGTSMATPHVTAGAARYLALHGSATPAEVRAGLIAEGSGNWVTSSDPDSAHEPLLAVVVPTPSPTPSPSPSPSPWPSPTPSPSPSPSPSPTPTPSGAPGDSVAPVMTGLTLGDPISAGTRAAATWRTHVTWTATDNVAVTGYHVELRTGSGSWAVVYDGASTRRTLDLPTGSFRVRVRARDAAGNASAWKMLTRSATISDLTSTQAVSRTTSWTTSHGRSAAWAGTRYLTNVVGQRLTIRTDSRMSALIAQMGPSGGRFAIYVDGTKVATVDLAADATHDRRVVWSAAWPSRTTRTIEVRTLGSPGADTVWLDAVLTLR